MILIDKIRQKNGLSQRTLAKRAGIAYKTVQLIEKGEDVRLSTLDKVLQAIGFPKNELATLIGEAFGTPPESVFHLSRGLVQRKRDWSILLFNFVDAFRRTKEMSLISWPPQPHISDHFMALVAGTVETLCDEVEIAYPFWCAGVESLSKPWFLSGSESLKATALVESPVHFRKRNIFVLGNFLQRT